MLCSPVILLDWFTSWKLVWIFMSQILYHSENYSFVELLALNWFSEMQLNIHLHLTVINQNIYYYIGWEYLFLPRRLYKIFHFQYKWIHWSSKQCLIFKRNTSFLNFFRFFCANNVTSLTLNFMSRTYVTTRRRSPSTKLQTTSLPCKFYYNYLLLNSKFTRVRRECVMCFSFYRK